MAALSYMQRRTSGTYEFRKRLPEALAGKPVPSHMRDGFTDLINAKTGRFKRELVRSLQTKDVKEAKTRDHRAALQASNCLMMLSVRSRPVTFPSQLLQRSIWKSWGVRCLPNS